jgi:hypothetical protein
MSEFDKNVPTDEEDKRLAADILDGKVEWCETCEEWAPADEMRDDSRGIGERICIDCLADQGIEDPEIKEGDQ